MFDESRQLLVDMKPELAHQCTYRVSIRTSIHLPMERTQMSRS